MGLLDVLGQVLGGMAQQGGMGQPGGMGQAGRQAPGGPDLAEILARMGGAQGGMPGGMGGGMGMPGGLPGGMGLPQGMPGGGMPGGMGGMAAGGGLIAIIAMAMQMLQRNGGLENVLGRLQEQGYGDAANSWVSDGSNAPISPDILSQIFGREEIGRAAQEMGMSPDEAAGGLASVFPEIVNQMTPQGRVDSGSNDVVAQALEMLKRQQRG